MSFCNKKVCLYHIYLIALSFIVIYGFVIKQYIKTDVFETKFLSCEGCDIWGIFHFLLYLLLSYYFPSFYILFFFIGIGYELFEYYVGVTDNEFKKLGPITSDGKQSWWYGRMSDIFFNTFGILIGLYISPYK
jgi:hypothetical protein